MPPYQKKITEIKKKDPFFTKLGLHSISWQHNTIDGMVINKCNEHALAAWIKLWA